MVYEGTACMDPSARRRRIFAVLAVAMVLTVQLGLAMHGASHLHDAGEAGDCQLCVLASHFVFESPSSLILVMVGPVVVLYPEQPADPFESTLPTPSVRGPPAFSV